MMAGTTVIKAATVYRHCGTAFELTPKEVILNIFICPNCSPAQLTKRTPPKEASLRTSEVFADDLTFEKRNIAHLEL